MGAVWREGLRTSPGALWHIGIGTAEGLGTGDLKQDWGAELPRGPRRPDKEQVQAGWEHFWSRGLRKEEKWNSAGTADLLGQERDGEGFRGGNSNSVMLEREMSDVAEKVGKTARGGFLGMPPRTRPDREGV